MRVQDHREHPHGLFLADFDALFPTDRPLIFAYHGYPWSIHRLTYRRTNHDTQVDRFDRAIDAMDRMPGLQAHAGRARRRLGDKLIEHRGPSASTARTCRKVAEWTWSR